MISNITSIISSYFFSPQQPNYFEIKYNGEITACEKVEMEHHKMFTKDDLDIYYDPINYNRKEFNENATRLCNFQIFGNVFISSLNQKVNSQELLKLCHNEPEIPEEFHRIRSTIPCTQ